MKRGSHKLEASEKEYKQKKNNSTRKSGKHISDYKQTKKKQNFV